MMKAKIDKEDVVVGNIIEGVDGEEIIVAIVGSEVFTRVLEDAGNRYEILKDGCIEVD